MTDPVVPVGAVVITQREVYDKIVAIEAAVTGLPGRVEKLEAELDGIRSRVFILTGGSAVAGTVIGALIQRAIGG